MSYELLETISSPDELKKLDKNDIPELCSQIRQKLIDTVSHTGGHIASNLGVVELTVALHRVFDSPKDQIMFDVGHQCYVHKLLTGRFDRFDTLRQENGLAGFPKPCESEHDPMISGHSSTSISAACGLAKAKKLNGDDHYVIAIIGDGALTGGLAYEGLNNAGRSNDRLIVILNDNKMSINKNVGAVARHLAVLRTKKKYFKFKSVMKKVFCSIPLIGTLNKKIVRSSSKAVKSTMYKSTLFEDMGFAYLGPVDGHDEQLLENVLEAAKMKQRPTLVHICTLKGKGYTYAEKKPRKFHGVNGFDAVTGEPNFSGDTYSSVFGNVLCELAEKDDKICAVTAAMKSGTGLDQYAERFRSRFFDVGIAEAHATVFCAGLAANGYKPVFAVYSSFSQRAFDQIIHDVAIAKENVTFVIDRAGIVGDDGETHQGVFDVSMLLSIPGVKIFSPCYFRDIKPCLTAAVNYDGPAVVRIPRGKELSSFETEATAENRFIGSGKDILIVSYGRITAYAVELASQQELSVLKLTNLSEISDECLDKVKEYPNVIFFEEGMKNGGAGQMFGSLILERGFKGRFVNHAIEPQFIAQASVPSTLARLGLDKNGMESLVREVRLDERKA